MTTATRTQWIEGCEEQIASVCAAMTSWDVSDDECLVVLQDLVREWEEATA